MSREIQAGARFGRLTVLQEAPFRPGNPNRRWECKCDCGATTFAYACLLKVGRKVDCGQHVKHAPRSPRKHMLSRDPVYASVYKVWENIRARCYNPEHRSYLDYGGRGITVCERWLSGDGNKHGAACLAEDMGPRPSPGHSIERKDNSKGYEPGNCIWATRQEQARNKRSNRFIQFGGRNQTLIAWAQELGISQHTISTRLSRGWSLENALSAPRRGAR